MKILVDTREQRPFSFAGPAYSSVEIVKGTLPTGDYSVLGFENECAVERKSADDLIMCLTRNRDRFTKELIRTRGLCSFAVVVECSMLDIAQGNYRSRMNPKAAVNSILGMMAKYGTAFIFAGTRSLAEWSTYNFLRLYLENVQKKYKELLKAHGSGGCAA